jgi:hypothetical protein
LALEVSRRANLVGTISNSRPDVTLMVFLQQRLDQTANLRERLATPTDVMTSASMADILPSRFGTALIARAFHALS